MDRRRLLPARRELPAPHAESMRGQRRHLAGHVQGVPRERHLWGKRELAIPVGRIRVVESDEVLLDLDKAGRHYAEIWSGEGRRTVHSGNACGGAEMSLSEPRSEASRSHAQERFVRVGGEP